MSIEQKIEALTLAIDTLAKNILITGGFAAAVKVQTAIDKAVQETSTPEAHKPAPKDEAPKAVAKQAPAPEVKAPEPQAPAIDYAAVKAAVVAACAAGRKADVIAALKSRGVSSAPELAPEQWPDFHYEVSALCTQ